jgi:hypothetical protein
LTGSTFGLVMERWLRYILWLGVDEGAGLGGQVSQPGGAEMMLTSPQPAAPHPF